jgi:hypothetical protein
MNLYKRPNPDPILQGHVKEFLVRSHSGKLKAIDGKKFLEDFKSYFPRYTFKSMRPIRWALFDLRIAGQPACSEDGLGYWWGETEEEAHETISSLRAKARSLREAADGMEAGIPAYFGHQARLQL